MEAQRSKQSIRSDELLTSSTVQRCLKIPVLLHQKTGGDVMVKIWVENRKQDG